MHQAASRMLSRIFKNGLRKVASAFTRKNAKNQALILKKPRSSLPPIEVNGEPLKVVEEAKLLGLTITPTLKGNKNVNNMSSKSSKRIYLFVQLKRARVPNKVILQLYSSFIYPILEYEYASNVFNIALPKQPDIYLSDKIQ